MEIEFENYYDTLFINLMGELDHHSLKQTKGRLEMKLGTNTTPFIVINLDGLTFMDSSSISLIYSAYKIANSFNQKVYVVTKNEKYKKILTLSKMEEFVKIQTNYRKEVK